MEEKNPLVKEAEKSTSNEKSQPSTPETPEKKQQQRSDPQLTELKGLTDPEEDLEVKGTDNPF